MGGILQIKIPVPVLRTKIVVFSWIFHWKFPKGSINKMEAFFRQWLGAEQAWWSPHILHGTRFVALFVVTKADAGDADQQKYTFILTWHWDCIVDGMIEICK